MTKNSIHVLSRGVLVKQDHILLCKTLDLPVNFYFLPGGHIEPRESAEQALEREFKEESGFECVIKRFLGCLEHSFDPGHNSICHNHEYNFVFEIDSETLTLHTLIVQQEAHIELQWISLSSLEEIDLRAEPFKTLILKWLKAKMNETFVSVMK